MIYRPGGLLPSKIAKRELHVPDAPESGDPSAVPAAAVRA
jgi:hypothetical protein